MTGRRAVRQWDERLSRALQFVPGHVGGRVASAQPIRRRGGTLRQASVGAGGTLPEYLIGTWYGSTTVEPTIVGGAGQSTLNDGSDATYIVTGQGLTDNGEQWAFAFAPITAASVSGATLHVRAKSPDSTQLAVAVAGSYVRSPGSGLPYYYTPAPITLTTSWADYSLAWTAGGGDWSDGVLPSVAALAAGTVEVLVNVRQSAPYNGHVAHVAEAWLEITP